MCPIPALAAVAAPDLHALPGGPDSGSAQLRPRLLMAAARHGMGDYRRARDLMRLLGCCPGTAAAVAGLTKLEATAEAARRAGSPAWSCTRHVEVLIALLAERAVFGS